MPNVEQHPDNVGPYRILEVLGEGGMGIVYLAEQIEPIRRRVALKHIKFGMDTKQIIARFESERQALALMSHENVAKVLDAGSTDNGRPYFVMEYVPGIPITDYCDRHKLTMPQRLQLFVPVCNAVQHAHQKGIIHRDIKPSNILVMLQDGRPIPKIIDFGVAKATERHLTEKTLFTEHGQLIGTPEYMSPEQAEMTPLDVDTRTDIYALGVVLYELLTGVLPFDRKTLRAAGYAEIRRIIREVEPMRPSTRLSTMGDDSTALSQKRQTDPRSLVRQLRGDLDWITMKALEKDRTRRYATASELAADIERHARHEPVLAGPPSLAYRLTKLIRKHRVHIAVGACVVLAAATSIMLVANVARGRAERVTRLIASGVQETDHGRWDAAEPHFRDALQIDPDNVRALVNLARLKLMHYGTLGEAPDDRLLTEASELCEHALRLEPEYDKALNAYGVLLKKLARYQEAIEVYSKIIELGPNSYFAWVNRGTAHALNGNLAAAEADLLQSTRLAHADVPYAVQTWRNLASLQLHLGQGDQAMHNIENARDCNPRDVATWIVRARIMLERDVDQAFESAVHADLLAEGRSPKTKRLRAQARLRTGDYAKAVSNARAAIALGDMPAVNHLIQAVAHANLGNRDEARNHLQQAAVLWPGELKQEGGFIATAGRGALWFESEPELSRLRARAEQVLASQER